MQKLIQKIHFLTFIILCIVCVISPPNTLAQERSTEGTEFWMSFMENGLTPERLDLFITSKFNTSGEITLGNPTAPTWSATFSVAANNTTIVTLPAFAHPTYNIPAGNNEGGTIRTTGVRITSDDNISIAAINNSQFSTDASIILPTTAIGSQLRHIVSTRGGAGSQILIVAIDDDVLPRITLPNGNTIMTQSMRIDKGEVYLFKANYDLTGAIVEDILNPCSSFAVFAGHEVTTIPDVSCGNADHIYAQQYPIKTWEKEYYVAPFGIGNDINGNTLEQDSYILRIIRDDLSTTATLNGAPITWNNNRYHNVEIGREGAHIVADQPISVAQYMKGQACNGLPQVYLSGGNFLAKGDPALLVLNPSIQTVNSAVFNTTSTDNLSDHFVNVIVRTEDVSTVSLDGVIMPSSEFTAFASSPNYSYAISQIAEGSHTIECANGLVAYCYGVGVRESYAYTVGARFEDLGYNIDISTDFSDPDISDAAFSCLGFPTNFTGSGENITEYNWDFGDGNIGSGENVSHTYASVGTYTVTFTASIDDDGCGNSRDISIERTVTVQDFPAIPNIAEGTLLCIDGSGTLNIDNFDTNLSYQWYKDGTAIAGEEGQLLTVSEEGEYYVETFTEGGCNGESSLTTVSVNPDPSFNEAIVNYCAGSIDLFTTVSDAFNNPANSVFSIGGNVIADPSSFDPASDPAVGGLTSYTILFAYTTDVGCESTDTQDVTLLPFPDTPIVSGGSGLCLDVGNSETLTIDNLDPALTYTWFKDGVEVSTGTTLTVSETGSYQAQAFNGTCTSSESIAIEVNFKPQPSFQENAKTYCTSTGFINLFNEVNESDSNASNSIFSIGGTVIADPSNFDPATDPAVGGLTSYFIDYNYSTDAGCDEDAIPQSISIVDSFVDFTIPLSGYEYCEDNGSTINLFDFIEVDLAGGNSSTGSFEINGVTLASAEAQNFNPANYTSPYTIRYTFDSPTCVTNSESFVIYPNPTPTFSDTEVVLCLDETYDITSILSPSEPANTVEFSVGGTTIPNPSNIIVSDFGSFGESFEVTARETFTSTSGFVICEGLTSKTINIRPRVSAFNNLSEGQNVCRSEAPIPLTVDADIEGSFLQSIDGGSFTTLPSANFDPSVVSLEEGETKPVVIRFVDICGESFEVSVLVREFTLFEDKTTYRICPQNSEIIELDAKEVLEDNNVDIKNVSYVWSSGEEGTNRISATNPNFDYFVTVDVGADCPVRVRFFLVERADCTPSFGLPNAFSPNGDGLNDVLEIKGQYFDNFEIAIFNRWGEMVFNASRKQLFLTDGNNSELFWNGRIRGKEAPEGTYICKIRYQLPNEPEVETTHKVTLIR